MTDQEGRFEGVEEVAERLLVDPQTVRRWIKSGKLKAYKPGREFRIKSTDLEAFLKTREVGSIVPKVRVPARVVESLRALPFEQRTTLFEFLAVRDEPFEPGLVAPVIGLLEGLDSPMDMTLDEFFDFLIHANTEEAQTVLFAGAETVEQKRRAGAAFVSAVAGLIRQGRVTGAEVAERLAVAGQIQAGAA
jgi:excisionase family DNA binding protein